MSKRTKINESIKNKCWNELKIKRGVDPNCYRIDKCNNLIHRESYGLNTKMGWEVDHKKPISKGGSNNINNLQALQTSQNRDKSNKLNYNYSQQKVKPKGVNAYL